MKTIYLDNNATTAVAPEVREAMLPYLTDLYGNPSSMHTFGGQVGRAVEEARERMAALLGAHPDEIIFTSCGSESDNAAIWSALQTQPEKRHLITTRVEHPAILNVAQYWERQGYRVTLLGVDNKGRLDLDEYAAALSDDTALVSIMYANNEVGNVFPISRMAEMAAEKGVDVDVAGFEERFKKHQENSHAGAEQRFKGGLADNSEATAKLHTATHLLQAALRRVLGDEVHQKGSNITAERLRFDFSFGRKMTPEEIAEVERLVNEAIQAKVPVTCEEMTVDEAKAQGAIGLFTSKYGERVKVYTMGDFSKEICGGPHASNTGDLKSFKIKKEESSSAGVRRIKAVIGQ